MRWPARLVSTTSALLVLSCASAPPEPPEGSSDRVVPVGPPEVEVQVDEPSVSTELPVPWSFPRPHLQVNVRAPEAAVRDRTRSSRSGIEVARERLEGAWSFVYGETIGMAIFEGSGRAVLQALGGDKVSLTFRVLRAPGSTGSEPGRLQLRTAPDSAMPGPSAGPDEGAARLRFRALFKWRSAGQVDLQVPSAGDDWPDGFGRDRFRLFRNVEEAIRFLERRERRWFDAPAMHRAD